MIEKRHRARSLVLRTDPSTAEAEVERFADALGWPCRGEIPADPRQGIPYEVQWSAGPALTLHFLIDDLSNTPAVTVSGDDPQAVDAAAQLTAKHLNTFSTDELLESARRTRRAADKARALVQAGIGASENFNQPLFNEIRDNLANKDTRLREAAIWAMSYVPFPQYRELLQTTAQEDPDRRLRDIARNVLAAFDRGGVPGS
ncbi:hypothetical protein [Saccharothrix sp. Mg75]|uniref:hypothetical protein n=1 Tax=Saccharothrix sp. Mg75 TaxID=3445357 RepID=UPI003EE85B15